MRLQDYVTSGNRKYLGNKYRDARFAFFQEKIEKLKKPVTILDVGGTEKYWIHRGYQDNTDIQITLLNIEKISTSHSNIVNIVGDATDLSMFQENEFNVVFSNSVIEHLYTFANQKSMANEVIRVGTYHFIQTPNKLFFLEPHYLLPFIQFAPPGLKYFILTKQS
jgi:predicted SAM-dependent methyltransferase